MLRQRSLNLGCAISCVCAVRVILRCWPCEKQLCCCFVRLVLLFGTVLLGFACTVICCIMYHNSIVIVKLLQFAKLHYICYLHSKSVENCQITLFACHALLTICSQNIASKIIWDQCELDDSKMLSY